MWRLSTVIMLPRSEWRCPPMQRRPFWVHAEPVLLEGGGGPWVVKCAFFPFYPSFSTGPLFPMFLLASLSRWPTSQSTSAFTKPRLWARHILWKQTFPPIIVGGNWCGLTFKVLRSKTEPLWQLTQYSGLEGFAPGLREGKEHGLILSWEGAGYELWGQHKTWNETSPETNKQINNKSFFCHLNFTKNKP